MSRHAVKSDDVSYQLAKGKSYSVKSCVFLVLRVRQVSSVSEEVLLGPSVC